MQNCLMSFVVLLMFAAGIFGKNRRIRKQSAALMITAVSLLVFAFPLQGRANTLLATTCSRAAVASAVANATYGDTVVVPNGTCPWSSALTITKGISLVGGGSSQTTIQSGAIGSFMLIYNPDATSVSTNAKFEVSGFTFDMANTGDAGIWINNTSATPISRVLIHDNIFKNMNAGNTSLDPACLRLGENGDVYGVAYSNIFQDCKIVGENYGNYQTSWNTTAFNYGSANNFYWEDNTMTGNSTFHYAGHGGRYVTRFNTYTFNSGTWEVVWDMHGNQPSGVYGTMGCEHYNNIISLVGGTTVVDHRGGQCVIFNNAVTGSSGTWQVREEYGDSIDPTTNPEPQRVSDSYYFRNTVNGSNQGVAETQDCCNAIAANQQYWNYTTSFNGTVGVGSGLLSARPSTCTAGVGYWATDQGEWNSKHPGADGQLYKCTGNAWTLYYLPYPYPHPLRAGSSIAPPTNLSVLVN